MIPMCMLQNDHYENYNFKLNKQKNQNYNKITHITGRAGRRDLLAALWKLITCRCIKIAFGPPELSRYAPAQVWQEDSSQKKKLICEHLWALFRVVGILRHHTHSCRYHRHSCSKKQRQLLAYPLHCYLTQIPGDFHIMPGIIIKLSIHRLHERFKGP